MSEKKAKKSSAALPAGKLGLAAALLRQKNGPEETYVDDMVAPGLILSKWAATVDDPSDRTARETLLKEEGVTVFVGKAWTGVNAQINACLKLGVESDGGRHRVQTAAAAGHRPRTAHNKVFFPENRGSRSDTSVPASAIKDFEALLKTLYERQDTRTVILKAVKGENGAEVMKLLQEQIDAGHITPNTLGIHHRKNRLPAVVFYPHSKWNSDTLPQDDLATTEGIAEFRNVIRPCVQAHPEVLKNVARLDRLMHVAGEKKKFDAQGRQVIYYGLSIWPSRLHGTYEEMLEGVRLFAQENTKLVVSIPSPVYRGLALSNGPLSDAANPERTKAVLVARTIAVAMTQNPYDECIPPLDI